MTPFQQLRYWARRAPNPQRLAAAVGAAVVLALLGWLMVPSSDDGNATAGSFDVSAGRGADATADNTADETVLSTPTTTAGGAVGGNTIGSPGAGSTGTATDTASGSAKCVSPPGSDQGITATQIKIAVLLINATGATSNRTFGVPDPPELQQNYQAVIDDVNASGGVACRKLVAQFFTPNAIDQNSLHQACLDIQQAKVFAVLDDGAYTAYPQLATCYPQANLPYWAAFTLPLQLKDHYYPYLFSGQGVMEFLLRNAAFAYKQQGLFDPANGFKKYGVVYRDCTKEYFPEYVSYLHAAGLQDSQMTSYNLGCSAAIPFAAPTDVAAAVSKFKDAGVTHVSFIDDNPDFGPFTIAASKQNFKPKYLISDENIIGSANSSTANFDPDNIDTAIGITPGRYGESSTPGLAPTAGTAKCNAILTKRGRPTSYEDQGVGGVACDEVWMFAAAVDHAPVLQRNALAAGIQAARTVEWSYPYGPNDFSGQKATTAGQFWRTVQFSAGCHCWRVLGDPAFHPSFP